jgi:hypothetical protein
MTAKTNNSKVVERKKRIINILLYITVIATAVKHLLTENLLGLAFVFGILPMLN